MTVTCAVSAQHACYELRFTGPSGAQRSYAFPCDRTGRVDLDELADRDRTNYSYARSVVGRMLCTSVIAMVLKDHVSVKLVRRAAHLRVMNILGAASWH